ncbi:MAG: sulfatase-like hydrolase/transferase [Candidatus Korarchaeota archaeon]|nr:sulfatase-like hydrolase/transferase [Candidatus Korarchaeota archaeon]NIU82487.1 sulfatase-like hydrolase/transferase [Candidatus Thorarchaeota archaeon]NIW12973.1 sulfatase-like hydrolase/transferase [Candidatus Thorarchaeota archaeon]NIW51126.1 sulfatase-like hydrolase/transferase [Candidatus Korarchaeota archaeon]
MSKENREKRNVILITCDALRAAILNSPVLTQKIAPNVRKELLPSSVRFPLAFSNGPDTPSSFPSLFTSTYPLMFGGYDRLSSKRKLLSEWLQKQGYTTVAIHSNPHLSSFFGYNRGFDFFNELKGGDSRSHPMRKLRDLLFDLFEKNPQASGVVDTLFQKAHALVQAQSAISYTRAKETNERIFSWFRDHYDGRNFFLWVHYMDPHTPYIPLPEYREDFGLKSMSKYQMYKLYHQLFRTIKDPTYRLSKQDTTILYRLYKAEVRYMDEQLGALFQYLKEKGIWEDCLVILTSDHGEAFGEHGHYTHGNLYDEVIRVPLLIKFPERKTGKIKQLVSLLDLAPTICDFLGMQTPNTFQGESLLPLIDEQKNGRHGIFCEVQYERKRKNASSDIGIAYRTRKWKYIYKTDGKDELYNMKNDPQEKRNLLGGKIEIKETLKGEIMKHYSLVKKSKSLSLKQQIKKRISKMNLSPHKEGSLK